MMADFYKRLLCAKSKEKSILGRLPSLHVGCCLDECAALCKEDVVRFPIEKQMVEDGPCVDGRYIIGNHGKKEDIAG